MELQRREEELARREREIQVKEGVITSIQKKNWPICKPFLYHNIKEEIQPGLKQKVCYIGYFTWMGSVNHYFNTHNFKLYVLLSLSIWPLHL
jgi:hypothetical protein